MKRALIGIDVGTTGTKSILFSETGELLARAYAPYPLSAPAVGRVEQNAEDWWKAVVSTVREVVAASSGVRVAAISLSLQGGTFVAVDGSLRPVAPAVVWNDERCQAEKNAFIAEFGADYMYEKSGWHLSGALNAMQAAWLRRNDPGAFSSARQFLSVASYISAKMTGRAVTDISDAGIEQMADIRTGKYDPRILAFSGVREDQLAEIVPSGTAVGRLTPEAAAELGLSEEVVFAAGAHDQYAGLLGAGVIGAGDVLIGSGTAWVVTALSDHPDFESGFSQSVSAVPGKWGTLVSLSTGGVCLDWFRKNVALGQGGEPISYDLLNAEASHRAPGVGGLMFFPYFNGSGFPLSGEGYKAAFVGLDLSHDRFDMARAVMEGVAFQTGWTLQAFDRRYGTGNLKLSGGAAKSPLWSRIMADIAGRPLELPGTPDLPCVGAAVLAGKGSGVFTSVEEGSRVLAVKGSIVEPDEAEAKVYAGLLTLYKQKAKSLAGMYSA